MVETAIVIFYTLVFSFIFYKWKALKGNNSAWKKEWIVALFLLKVSVGMFYGWSSHRFLNAPDSRHFYYLSKVVSSALPEHPKIFAELVFAPRPNPIPAEILPYKGKIPVWHNKGSFTMVRLHAFFGLFSGNKYFVNIIFWNLLATIGLVLLWRAVYSTVETSNKKRYLQAFLCLNPSLLFWASGAHKEGIALFTIGIILFFATKNPRNWAESLMGKLGVSLLLLFTCGLLYCTRHYYFAMLLVAVFVFLLAKIFQYKKTSIFYFFAGVYALGIGVVVALDLVLKLEILKPLVAFRNEFITVTQGRSDFDLPLIKTSWQAVSEQIPVAFINTFLRPFPWDIIHFRSFLACAETLSLLALFVFLLLKIKWNKQAQALPFLLIFFGVSSMLTIGLVVDNSGAIVRYRSVPYILLLVGMLACVLSVSKNAKF